MLRGAGVFLGLASLAPMLGEGPLEGRDFAGIRARGALRVLAAADENPVWFSMNPSPKPGFEREILEGFARLHKLELVLVPVARWDQAIPDLLKGRGDVLAGVNATAERQKLIDFTGELLPSLHIVVSRRPHLAIRSLDDLRAQRVGVIPDTTWAEAVAAAGVPASRVESLPDVAACVEGLRSARITATVMDVTDYLLQRRTDAALEDGVALGSAGSSAWGVRKTDPDLRRELNLYLENVKRTPTWSRLVIEYFGDDGLRVLGRAHGQ
jgi:ABC-type amino acid transport substrate-binding protein